MSEIKSVVARTVLKVLRPLVRILIRYEVSHSEFSELAKRAYVDVAYKHYSIPGRKQTYSRVSVITGLSRKEVVRLSQTQEAGIPSTKGPINRANRVIGGWLSENDFLDADGQPKILPLRGEEICFETLAERFSGDITGRAILDELIRVGAVKKVDKNHVALVQQGFIPQNSEAETLKIVAKHSSDLLTTGVHNLTHEQDQKRFQRQVTYSDLPESVIQEFQHYSNMKSTELLKDYNRWLREKKKSVKPGDNEELGRIGVGIYYFRNDNNEE